MDKYYYYYLGSISQHVDTYKHIPGKDEVTRDEKERELVIPWVLKFCDSVFECCGTRGLEDICNSFNV